LLDRWGQVIQYFPRYGPANNRTADGLQPYGGPVQANASISAGPLFGYSQPYSVDSNYGYNTIWDWRDGAPLFANQDTVPNVGSWQNPVTGNPDVCVTWPDPTNDMSSPPNPPFQPELAIEWMLGDLPTHSGLFNNEIVSGEKLGWDGPFILISTGPDGPELGRSEQKTTVGGYCNLASVPINQLQQTFLNSGNIYNFDHQ
jgi:hypothetical protein